MFLLLLACSTEPAPAPTPPAAPPKPVADAVAVEMLSAAQGVFKVLPERMDGDTPATQEQIDLGRRLYFEKRMSKNHEISCASCHQLDRYGVDGEPTSPGHEGVRGGRNSPTTFNAALHIAQFWDGREPTVEAQAKGPVLNPVEMGMPDAGTVVAVLKGIPDYAPAFGAAFPGQEDPITFDNVATAIGAFERGLVTPSPFDAYLNGDAAALSAEQAQGLKVFMDTGCQGCHNGVDVGGGQYRKLGERVAYETQDKGLGALNNDPAQDFMFKVPSLRNITETGPYFHDGSITSLDQAITLMGKHQLDVDLSTEQVAQITAFLGSLKGTVDAKYCKEPKPYAAGESAPAADPS